LSHNFIAGIEESRDALYTAALAKGGTPGAAEQLLQQTARALFTNYARAGAGQGPGAGSQSAGPVGGGVPASSADSGEIARAFLAALEGAPGAAGSAGAAGGGELKSMPADVWARVAAAIQLEAARSSNAKALNPDSVLLRPDPLLAPKRTTPHAEKEEFDLSSPVRLIVLVVLAVAAGVSVTYWLTTRPAPPGERVGGGMAATAGIKPPATALAAPATSATERGGAVSPASQAGGTP
jgi:hypothetical protein